MSTTLPVPVDGDEAAGARVYQLHPERPGPVDRPDDAEAVRIVPPVVGGPVDPPAEHQTLYATVINRGEQDREPLVAAWVRNPDQRRVVVRAALDEAGYRAARHTLRSPKYAARVALYAPWGVVRVVARQLRWWWHPELSSLLQEAASTANLERGPAIERQLAARRKARGVVLFAEALLVAVGLVVLLKFAPSWARWLALAVAVPVLAWAGRPADKPIIDRTVTAPGFTRLTAEMVRAALVDMGAVKDPASVTFPAPGIHTDGPGYLARVNLPHGVEAVKVISERGRLSSALRLPVDQVWPTAGPEHAGQLDLWVGKVPSSQMGTPRWALASSSARVSVFEGYPVGHDERLRPVKFTPFQRNVLIGGQPGSGKTFGGRAMILGALLDPTVEVWLAAFKPAEDFLDVSGHCRRYVCGIDDVTMTEAAQMVADGLVEVQRRQTLLGKLKRAGKITEGRTSPELAAAGIGLHPLFLVFDEVHELFLESKQVQADMARLLKQGRSAGVIVVLITQVASRDSVPPEITRVVSTRWCMSVADQVANDQIMGTGSYKRGITGTAYRPEIDAGWGVTSGLAGSYMGPVRAYYPGQRDLAVLLARIEALRAGGGYATTVDPAPGRDFLADMAGVFYAGEAFVSWQSIAARLAEQLPEHYGAVTAEAVSAQARALGVPTEDGRDKARARVLKGAKLTAVEAAAAARQLDAGTDPGGQR